MVPIHFLCNFLALVCERRAGSLIVTWRVRCFKNSRVDRTVEQADTVVKGGGLNSDTDENEVNTKTVVESKDVS